VSRSWTGPADQRDQGQPHFGVSATTYYRWAGRAQRYRLAALLPKGRRPPVMPTATPPDQVKAVLAEAVARPTIGARRLVDHLAERGCACRPLECRSSMPTWTTNASSRRGGRCSTGGVVLCVIGADASPADGGVDPLG
jgi:hypothetical protein